MHIALAAIVAGRAASAFAGDITAGAQVGAGAQGASMYDAVELRLDATWPGSDGSGVRIGLGARGVWDDGTFRREWSSAADAVTLIRDVELAYVLDPTSYVALAAGRLAPAHVGRLVDGYRSTLDDRWRTGVRGAATTRDTTVGIEIDDVLDPALIGGGVAWQMADPFGVHVAVAVDPGARSEMNTQGHVATAIEVGGDRRYELRDLRVTTGVSIVAELGLGVGAVAFADGALVRGDTRWTARLDARAGTGTNGASFGPLYRVERLAHGGMESLWDRARHGELDGGGLGGSVGVASTEGWIELGARVRPGLGVLGIANVGAPMGKWLQAGVWAAAAPDAGAGAAELRVAWAKRLYSALDVARMYRFDAMDPIALWSVTAWFGATTD